MVGNLMTQKKPTKFGGLAAKVDSAVLLFFFQKEVLCH
jgi:hypothetical protein